MKTDLYLILLWAEDDISVYNLSLIWAGFNINLVKTQFLIWLAGII